MDRITQALTRIFDKHRIVFWFDAKKELRKEFEALSLAGIEKIELNNNEFGIKYHILREAPEQKFLLYHEGAQPEDINNWLLDVQLAHGEFRTDQAGIWLSELDLGPEFADIVQNHGEFFNAAKRREGLKRVLADNDTPGAIRLKMLAICSSADTRLESVIENLLAELAESRDDKIKLIKRCDLEAFLLEQLERCYGYKSATPGIRDFAIELFKSCYAMETNGTARLGGDALVFLKRWKDSRQYEASYEKLATECSELLDIEHDLGQRDFRDLLELDYFRIIDQKILSDLVQQVVDRTIPANDSVSFIRQRRSSHWYSEFRNIYEAIDVAARFIAAQEESNLAMQSMSDGIQRYCQSWFRLDQLYRKFIFHAGKSGQTSLLEQLNEQIENLYSNNFLLKVNDAWQKHVDAATRWGAGDIPLQRDFFSKWVQPFLKDNKKIIVIISDALRYEIGEELIGLIRQEDRYTAKLDPALAMLPSYTQLGMAALLPNRELSLAQDDTGAAFVNGISSQGTANRTRILAESVEQRSTAVKADEIMRLNGDDCRALLRDHDLIYVYHNRIDATGDKQVSEERAFEAVEETLLEIIRLIKKLAAANANNLLITTDHGFIYQNRAIDESDFLGAEASGSTVLFRDRRFVIGKGMNDNQGLRTFTVSQLGLTGDQQVQIPKSINRLRLKGSGSRYVHGGASLQETVIPVIQINKKRQSDTSAVEIEILRGATSIISSGQLSVVFYQVQPACDKVQSRTLRAGIYTQAGELISDRHELKFDLASDNPRDREMQVRFVLSRKADAANGQEVLLKLEERVGATSHYREYKSARYLVRRSFTSDFDF
ncbi:MAG: BREX-1 system phosphatase PglZ type A [Desulfuromonadaceae bacterium]